MSSKLSRDDIDISSGDEDVAFVHTEIDIEEISDEDNSKEALLGDMEERGLKVENVKVIGIFRDEFSLQLRENAKIVLNGERIY